MTVSLQTLYDVIENTWPPASARAHGPWIIRDGQGGGQRVSAATPTGPVSGKDIAVAEAAMRDLDQPLLFMIRDGDDALDALLADAGYPVVDPVNLYACDIAHLRTDHPPRVATFCIWEPLEIMRDIWAAGGIGPARVEVMARAKTPKTAIFGRSNNRPAGAGFVSIHDGIAMVHALEVLERHRREGLGRYMMHQAAFWAADHGAKHMSVICTAANGAANTLYTSMGFTLVGQYHYRRKG